MGTEILNPGLYIIGSHIQGVCSGAFPENIGDESASWEKSIKRFGPWVPAVLNAEGGVSGIDAWRGEGYAGPESVFICRECASTMDVMRYMCTRGVATSWGSVITVSQDAGRGQRGRRWVSPAGNLFVSWFWPPFKSGNGSDVQWKNLSSLVAGGAVADFFSTAGIPVEVKWPNDLLYDGRKICGILVEDFNGFLITGIGINVESAPDPEVLFRDGSLRALSLAEIGKTDAPLDLWLEIVTRSRTFYERMIRRADPDFFLQWLNTRLAWKNRRIIIRELPDGEITATLSGLAPDGGLEIVRNGRIEVLYNGRILPAV